MNRLVDERCGEMFIDFCDALESEMSYDDIFGLHDQVTDLANHWNQALENLIQAKKTDGNIMPAIESMVAVTEEIGYAMESTASFSEVNARAEWLAMAQAAIETQGNNWMDLYDEDAALEAESILDEAMESILNEKEVEFMMPATEGANMDALGMLRKHWADTRALKKEMDAAKKDKNWSLAADKATEIARMSDQLSKDLDNIPDSVGSAVIVTIFLAVAALAAAAGAAAIGRMVGHEVGAKKGYEPAKEAGKKVAVSEYKDAYAKGMAAKRVEIEARNAPKAAPKAPTAPSAAPEKKGGITIKVGNKSLGTILGRGKTVGPKADGAKPSIQETVKNVINEPARQLKIQKELSEASKEVNEKAKLAGREAGRNAAKAALKKYTDVGEKVGTAGGAAAVGVPAATAALARIFKGKKIIDENGKPKKVPLTPNEWNALIRWAKGIAKHMKEKYLEKAKSFRARLAAKEAFEFYMTYSDPAIEEYLDDEWFQATEGVNAESIDIWRAHCKEISKLRKEMKYAAEAGDAKQAAQRARDISKKCDETMKMLDALPQSTFSMMLPKVVVMLIVSLVGVKVGPWLGQKGGKMIGANMARAAAQDLPKWAGKPIEKLTSEIFGVAGAVMPGIFAFKQLMAFLRGKIVVAASGKVTTTRLNPNEANAIMNMIKSSIRSCQRKYEGIAKDYDAVASKKDEDTKLLKGNEAEFYSAFENALYEVTGYRPSAFNLFLQQFC